MKLLTALPTPRDMLNLHPVWATCIACGRTRELDLAAIIERGQGDTPLVELRLRCECGGRKAHISVMGVGGATYP